jgi:hypothetical protein
MANAFDSAPMTSSLVSERIKFQSILLPLNQRGASFAEMMTQCVVGPVAAKERMAVFRQLEAVIARRFPAFAVSRDRTALTQRSCTRMRRRHWPAIRLPREAA